MSRRRKLGAALIGIVALLAVFELASFLALSLTEHRWMGWGAIRKAELEVVAAGGGEVEVPLEELDMPLLSSRQVLHPYLGYVLDRDFLSQGRSSRGGEAALDWGFDLSQPGLFHPYAPGQVVVAVTGGSVAHMLAFQYPDYLRRELLLRRRDLHTAVILSVALPGYKQPQQLMTLAYLLSLGVHLDAVVNLDGFNDIVLPAAENLRQGVFPFFPRSWSILARNLDPGARLALGRAEFTRDLRTKAARWASRPPWRYSLTVGLAWRRLDRVAAAALAAREEQLGHEAMAVGSSYQVAGPPRTYPDRGAMYRDLADYWRRCSEQMSRLATANGITYLHALQPNQYVAGSKPMDARERRQAINDSPGGYGPFAREGYPFLVEQGERLEADGAAFLDLTPILKEVREPVYIDDCCHMNALGNEIMARAVAERLARLLPPPEASSPSRYSAPAQGVGATRR